MPGNLRLSLLEGILPDGLSFGANYLVEFEPQSMWYEASLTLAADAMKHGIKTDFHTFTHLPSDIREALRRQVPELDKFEANDIFRIWDNFAIQTGLGAPEKVGRANPKDKPDLHSLKIADWDRGTFESIKAEVDEVDRSRLHIDDNTSIMLQYNDEKGFLEHFRTLTVSYVRRFGIAALHSVVTGLYSDSFYRQFESFCDGIIDFRSVEEGGSLNHYMRIRVMRGRKHDSSWRRVRLLESGEVTTADSPTIANAQEYQGALSGSKSSDSQEGKRRLAAIMFIDMVGFTALAQKDEPLAMELLTEQRSSVRPFFARHNGREVKTIGDAFLVEFGSSLEAVRCAVEIQSALREANSRRPEGRKVVVRIGIHLGDVIHTATDVAGDAVNVASRIEPLAPPGGVCVTEQVYESVVNKVGYAFESLGTPELKNVARPIGVYQVSDFGQKADRLPPAKGAPPKDRVAVLPFVNISSDPSDEYFADGMTEEVISAVSKVQGLRVIARTSVMRFKGASKPIGEIGKELNVGSVLEGSVRKAGDKIRITVQLVETSTEEPRWSREYDRQLEDVFAIQSDIAEKVAQALETQVLSGISRPAEMKATTSPQAYIQYLRGRQFWNKRTQDDLKKAIEYFEGALKIDENYAMAYSGLADAYAALALLEFMAPAEAYPKAKTAVEKSLSLDPNLAEAHTSLGLVKFQYDWDWRGAEQEFTKAIRLNPSYALAHHFFADYLKAMGRFDEALGEIGKAQELDPLSLAISAGVGHVLYLSRQYDKAIEQYKKAVELDPNFMQTHVWFGRPYLEKGMYEEAIAELETGVKLSGGSTLAIAMLGHGLASAGRREQALEILEKLKGRSKQQYVPSYWIAVVYNGLKDTGLVIEWLRKAFDERSSWLVWADVEPRFDWLRGDPDFVSLMKAMKFP